MTKLKLIIIAVVAVTIAHGTVNNKKVGTEGKTLNDYYNNYRKAYRKWATGRLTWPKKNGRCSHSPWKIDGINPVIEEAKRDNIVLLLAMKPNSKYSKHQLDYFNDLASYYKVTGWKFTVIALAHKSKKLPEYLPKKYNHVKFYQEPRTQDIFKMIRAKYGHVLIYDQCGRQQYSIGPPYSHISYDHIRSAITNTKYHYNSPTFCGPCSPYVEPTRTTKSNETLTEERAKVSTDSKTFATTPVVEEP